MNFKKSMRRNSNSRFYFDDTFEKSIKGEPKTLSVSFDATFSKSSKVSSKELKKVVMASKIQGIYVFGIAFYEKAML